MITMMRMADDHTDGGVLRMADDRQAGRQAGRHGMEAGRQAGRPHIQQRLQHGCAHGSPGKPNHHQN